MTDKRQHLLQATRLIYCSNLTGVVVFQTSDGKLPLDDSESRIPVLLIQQAGSRDQNGFGAGWDVILPAGWGKKQTVNSTK